jgi:hypothetical protein
LGNLGDHYLRRNAQEKLKQVVIKITQNTVIFNPSRVMCVKKTEDRKISDIDFHHLPKVPKIFPWVVVPQDNSPP